MVFDNERWIKDVSNALAMRGVSQRQLAKMLPISHSTLSRVLRDKVELSMEIFILVSALLDLIAVEYFDEDDVQMRMF